MRARIGRSSDGGQALSKISWNPAEPLFVTPPQRSGSDRGPMMNPLEAALDPEVVARLQELAARARPALLARLRDTYLTDARQRLAAMAAAVSDADAAALGDAAHALKGASASLGALR